MKKKISVIILTLLCLNIYSQNKENKFTTPKKDYIKLSIYKKIFNKKLTKKDSAKFKFSDGDTLVYVKNLHKKIGRKSKQHKSSLKHRTKSYMPLYQYKRMYSRIITKEDSLNFEFHKNDTLILVSDKDFYKNQTRVKVPYEVKDSSFLETYKDVVYSKYSYRKRNPNMRLWKDEIKIFFSYNTNKKVKKELIAFSKKLSNEVDSLKISIVTDIKKSNYIIYQTDSLNKFKFGSRLKDKEIGYYLFWNGKQQIYDCKLQIDTRKHKDLKAIISDAKLNFYLSMGYFSSSKRIPKNSLLSYFPSTKKKFSKIDLEILKYHYSYGICKFTNLETFEENHRRAKKVIKDGGSMFFTHIY